MLGKRVLGWDTMALGLENLGGDGRSYGANAGKPAARSGVQDYRELPRSVRMKGLFFFTGQDNLVEPCCRSVSSGSHKDCCLEKASSQEEQEETVGQMRFWGMQIRLP